MVTLRLFAGARELAGTRHDEVEATTVGEALDVAVSRYGEQFAALLGSCQIWRNGQPATRETEVQTGDEIAILPPISGG